MRADTRRAIAGALGRSESAIARPLTYDVGLGALVQWYPLDLALPVLARPLPELLRQAARAGIPVGAAAGPATRCSTARASVLSCALATSCSRRTPRRPRSAPRVAGFSIAGLVDLGRRPQLHGALPDLRLTVQAAIDGKPVPVTRALEVAPVAGAMLRVLHDAPISGLEPAPPRAVLEGAARGAALVAAVAPDLAVARATSSHASRSRARADAAGDRARRLQHQPVPRLDGTLAILDFDETCLAPAALDLASYTSNLVGGRDGDLARARAALDALVGGYGERPANLDWYLAARLLRRAPCPFRLHKKRWPQRVEGIVAAAEEVLGR